MNERTRRAVWRKYGNRCAYCGKEIAYKDMQVDHLIPKRANGTDDIENLMPSCRMCNHYKRASSLEVFRKMIEEIPKKLERDSYIYRVGVAHGMVQPKDRCVEFWFETWESFKCEVKE